MRSTIADDLDRTDMTTQINLAIGRAIQHYESEGFWFKETTGTFACVASQKAYTTSSIPSDIAEIDYMEVRVSGNDYPITQISYEEIESIDFSGQTGIPSRYAYYKQSLYLYPIPNSTYTVTISYKKEYTALSADSDTNDWTTEAEDLIEARALWWIYARILKDTEQANSYKGIEIDNLNNLRIKTGKLLANNVTTKATDF